MHTNPLFGTGYQSFWLGPRLQMFWENSGLGHLNEAHNGYLEVYLELGLIGVFLLIGFLIASYRAICRRFATSSSLAVLGLAVWLALLFYNMSEAAFEGGLLYMVYLLGAISLPERVRSRVRSVAAFDCADAAELLPKPSLEAIGMRSDKWSERGISSKVCRPAHYTLPSLGFPTAIR